MLRKWAVNDGKLWRFTRPYENKIDGKLVPPSAVGFEHFLYETPGIPTEYAQQLETGFMQRMDHAAARALEKLLSDDIGQWETPERSAWTRLISSLWFRTPENVRAFKDAIAALITKDDPQFEQSYRRDKPAGWPTRFPKH